MHVQLNSRDDKLITITVHDCEPKVFEKVCVIGDKICDLDIRTGYKTTFCDIKLGTILFTFFTPTLRVEEGEKHEPECTD